MYTISQVSELLGIPTVTIRAWEQRYGVVTPVRTESGYRLFTEPNIADLRWLKKQTEEGGLTISQAASLLKQRRSEQTVVVEEEKGDAAPQDIHAKTMEHLYKALCEFRTEQARAMLDLGFSMFGYDTMIEKLLVPLMKLTGDEWERGNITVAQEHYITQFVSQRCFSFFQLFPIDSRLPKVLAFCPSGEQHQVGLLLFSLFLRHKGVDVLYLGPDTPDDGLEAIIDEHQIGLVCMSLMDENRSEAAIAMIDRLRDRFPHLTFALGGQGFAGVQLPYAGWRLNDHKNDAWKHWYENHILIQTRPKEAKGERE